MKSLTIFIAVCLALTVTCGPCKPEQVHIALSDAYTSGAKEGASSIKVVFHTKEACENSSVTLHTNQGDEVINAAQVNHFKAAYAAGDYSTLVHEIDLPALQVGNTYKYTCNSQGENTGPFSFHVPNPNPESNKPTTVVMFGDLDTSENGNITLNALKGVLANNGSDISAFVHMGDFAYDLEYNAGKHGDRFMNDIEPLAANMPYMVFAGNHETLANFSNMNMRFKMPNFERTQNHLFSYNLGNIHFVVYNVELLELQPELLNVTIAWLEEDLKEANANRAQRPWIVVSTHRPIYCSKKHDDCLNGAKRYRAIEEVLKNGKVDLFISGHVHYYERMLPIYQDKVAQYEKVAGDVNHNYIKNAKAPVYILQGIAGHDNFANHKKAAKPKEWTANIDTTYAYNVIKSLNNTHLYVENVHSETGKVGDFMYLIKDAQEPTLVEA